MLLTYVLGPLAGVIVSAAIFFVFFRRRHILSLFVLFGIALGLAIGSWETVQIRQGMVWNYKVDSSHALVPVAGEFYLEQEDGDTYHYCFSTASGRECTSVYPAMEVEVNLETNRQLGELIVFRGEIVKPQQPIEFLAYFPLSEIPRYRYQFNIPKGSLSVIR